MRQKLLAKHNLCLRDLYRSAEKPGAHPMKDVQDELDASVRLAFGMSKSADTLQFLFDLNQHLASAEAQGKSVVGPGLPSTVNDPSAFITDDRLLP